MKQILELKEKTIKNETIAQRLPKSVLKLCKTFEVSEDLIDFESEFQSVNDFDDPLEHIKEIIIKHSPKNPAELQLLIQKKKDLDLQQEKAEAENELKRIDEEKRILNDFYSQDLDLIDGKAFHLAKNSIINAIKGGMSAIIESPAGTGKSSMVFQLLKDNKVNFAFKSTGTTHIDLIRFFYDNREKDVVVLDDTMGLWNNLKIVSMLKQATWGIGGKRIIDKGTPDHRVKDVLQQFEFKPHLVILTNEITNKRSPDVIAVLDRCFYTQIRIGYNELICVFEKIAQKPYKNLTDEQRKEVLDFVKTQSNPSCKMSIRTLIKSFDLYASNPANYKEMVISMLQPDPALELVYDLLNSGKPVTEQIKEFKEKAITLQLPSSRSSYFKLKGELK